MTFSVCTRIAPNSKKKNCSTSSLIENINEFHNEQNVKSPKIVVYHLIFTWCMLLFFLSLSFRSFDNTIQFKANTYIQLTAIHTAICFCRWWFFSFFFTVVVIVSWNMGRNIIIVSTDEYKMTSESVVRCIIEWIEKKIDDNDETFHLDCIQNEWKKKEITLCGGTPNFFHSFSSTKPWAQ